MLKVVVFDSGYGGEFFADYFQENLPTVEIIRVIDWRNAEEILSKPKSARKIAETALRPYIGRVDLIIFANHLLSITSLKFFRRKYQTQKFLGFSLELPPASTKRDILVLTTKAVTKTINYHNFVFRIKHNVKTLALDAWPAKIDDGELTKDEIEETLKLSAVYSTEPRDIVLACSQFNDIKTELDDYFTGNIKIYDSFEDALRRACKILHIRGGIGKKKS